MTVSDLYTQTNSLITCHTKWARGIREYMLEMLKPIISGKYPGLTKDSDVSEVKLSHLLNDDKGDFLSLTDTYDSEQWEKVKDLCRAASNDGKFLVHTDDIVEQLYTKSERTRARINNAIYFQGLAITDAVSYLLHGVKVHIKKFEPERYARLYKGETNAP